MARGKLRVYLGAAPGVGKTYAMLGEGHRRAERGTDVVVGFVETHGRQHTAEHARRAGGRAAARDRATAAPRSPRWTSTPCSPASPQVALVDELAHTNVPGLPQREALAGHRGAARRRHRRHLHGQHPAPRVAQRRRREDHRRAAARDACRTRSSAPPTRSSSSTWRPRRCAAGWRTATSTPPRRSTPRWATTSGSATSPRCASWRCCGSPTRSTRRCRATAPSTTSTAPGRPANGSSSRSPAARRARR